MGEYDPTHAKAKKAWLDGRFEEMAGPDGKFHDEANHQAYILSVLVQRALDRSLVTLTPEQRKRLTRAEVEAALGPDIVEMTGYLSRQGVTIPLPTDDVQR